MALVRARMPMKAGVKTVAAKTIAIRAVYMTKFSLGARRGCLRRS